MYLILQKHITESPILPSSFFVLLSHSQAQLTNKSSSWATLCTKPHRFHRSRV